MTPQIAVLLATYNRTMNERVFGAAESVDSAELSADRGAFFCSILGTLNHIVVGDITWMHRFAEHHGGSSALRDFSSSFARPTSLRQAMASDLTGLRAYRRKLDSTIDLWVSELTFEHLASTMAYTSMAGAKASKNFGAVLQHFFNHQTHHRGQVSALLFQAGADVGVTDLITLVPDDSV